MRKVLYLSGTRADFGLMRRTLKAIDADARLALEVAVTGMHLLPDYGLTVNEIAANGFAIAGRIETPDSAGSARQMAVNIARVIEGMGEIIARSRPDVLVLLGDRGEMLAGAIAATHEDVAIVHIHGGERSGTVDEPVRHAISKLAHFHFTSTQDARRRLIRMGEREDRVWVVGAPGLDGLSQDAVLPRAELLASLRLEPARPVALFVHHPVVQDADAMARETQAILAGLFQSGCQIVALAPNSDAGGKDMRAALQTVSSHPDFRLVTHFPRSQFVSWMAIADLMIGNSSAGIIEAGSFGTPVVNVGSRQNLRERNPNVTDVAEADEALPGVIRAVLARGRLEPHNVYGDGAAAPRIAALLASVPLDPEALRKFNVY
ncbi:UDP-N-acetylglucosamine 2-epimerase [Shinella sp. BYT-45]|uniref:UDP-N-acetylglucosamine 2-epimerase n=1 Tax=Shinella sp. BYT-45 TaxID=3377377 RepID=UPI00397FFAF9